MAKEAVKSMRYEEKEYFWILDMDATMVMHPFKSKLDGQDVSGMKDANGKKLFLAMVEEVKKSEAGYVNYDWPKPGEEKPLPKGSYVKGYQAWGWIIGSGIYLDDVDAIYYQQVLTLLLFGGVALVLLIAISLMVAHAVVKPIKHLKSVMIEVEKSGDLRRRVQAFGGDEVGEMATTFNGLLHSVQDSIAEVKSAVDKTAESAGQLNLITEQTKTGVLDTQSQAEQVATAMTEMSATVQEVARNATEAAQFAQTADREAGAGKQIVATTVDTINRLAEEVHQGVEVIQKLESDTDNIGTVLDVIRGIAEQTNLLALNAAIEAARAGDQGRGFAVVADEVRTLAKRTQESTEEIQQMIETLQEGARNAVRVMDSGRDQANISVEQAAKTGQSLESITEVVGLISGMNIRIATATEQQSAVAEEINLNVSAITDVAHRTSEGANQTAVAGEQLKALADSLDQKIDRYQV
jgi:methyl-accepting chemotaxis protein